MPVEFTCDGCSRRLRAPDAKAGKRVQCPTCGKELQIPVMSTPSPIFLPPAGAPTPNPLDQLAISIPTASEAIAEFELTKPSTPKAAGPAGGKPRSADDDIGLADVDAPAAPSGGGAGNASKPKSHSWRGGESSGPLHLTPRPAAPNPPGPNSPAPKAPGPSSYGPSTPGKGSPGASSPAPGAPKKAPTPAKPSSPAPAAPAGGSPADLLSLPMAGAGSSAGSPPTAGLAPVGSAPAPVGGPNPIDDIFKDLPQLAPVAPSPFGALQPVASSDPFASSGAALPQASAPRWDQIAASANVGSSNPYVSPSTGGGRSFRSKADIDSVRAMVMPPAIVLLICYILWIIYGLVNGVINVAVISSLLSQGPMTPEQTGRLVGVIIGTLIVPVLALAGLFGSIKMIRMKSWGACLTASIMAIFPFCICFPIGIWGVIVLSLENVRRAFEANERRSSY